MKKFFENFIATAGFLMALWIILSILNVWFGRPNYWSWNFFVLFI